MKKFTKKIILSLTIISVLIIVTASFNTSVSFSQTKKTIIDEWKNVEAPIPPGLKSVTINPKITALLILDIQNQNCNLKRRPRCVSSIPKIRALLLNARYQAITVIYSLTSSGSKSDIRKEVAPIEGEPIVRSGVDKFFRTDLEKILKEKSIETVILVGTSAHGAVLHTAAASALRGFQVIVPVDGMSAGEIYAEQYTAWHLVNGPGSRRRTTLTSFDLIRF